MDRLAQTYWYLFLGMTLKLRDQPTFIDNPQYVVKHVDPNDQR